MNVPGDPRENLANAIVLQAVDDWRSAKKILRRHKVHALQGRKKVTPRNDPQGTIDACERFFRSGWFQMLTRIDGEALLRKLREEEEGT